jgi:poly(A) polymerase
MNDLNPHRPSRPLLWPDIIFELKESLGDLPDEIYIVGGAVRDALLHRPLKDVDLATSGDAIRLARKIANHFNGDFFPLDSERDVGRALINTPEGRLMFDVARFRGEDILADLTDRDFTINAMAADLRGDLSLLLDPMNGEADIGSRQLRRCSSFALSNDPIRALRAVRQSVQLGLHIEAATLADIRAVKSNLTEVSPERLRDELFKLLTLPKPVSALRIADAVGLLDIILPDLTPLHGLQQSDPHIHDAWTHTLAVVDNLSNMISVLDFNRSDNLTSSFSMGTMAVQLDRFRKQLRLHINSEWPNERSHRALLMLAALMHDVGKPATATQNEEGRWRFIDHQNIGAKIVESRAEDLRLSNVERQRLVMIVRNHMRTLFLQDLTPRAVHRFWREMGDAGVDICLLSLADYLGTRTTFIDQDEWLIFIDRIRLLLEAYFDQHDKLISPPTLIDGNQLMQSFKLKPGRIIGELLDLIREAQVAGEIESPEAALAFAKDYLEKKKPG